jgi:hypothetical protein
MILVNLTVGFRKSVAFEFLEEVLSGCTLCLNHAPTIMQVWRALVVRPEISMTFVAEAVTIG